MEQERTHSVHLGHLTLSLTSHNIHLILSFLDTTTIISLINSTSNSPALKHPFLEAARHRHFLQHYLNRTDRSIYMPFYSQPLFLKMEHQQLSHLCSHSAPGLTFLSDSFRGVLGRLGRQLQGFECGSQVVESITESLTDPQLPFPKLRKQSIGMHCNSSFQFFLVDRLSARDEEEELQETFEQLGNFLNGNWNLHPEGQQKNIQIIQEVFSSWFKIGYQNYQNYLIPDSPNHNLVVLVIALLDLLVDSSSFYLDSIHDPLYSFIEFNMRYCIFRNAILSLEEKLSFLFKNYSAFCGQILDRRQQLRMMDESAESGEGQRQREMTIWHCGLSKWYIYMQRHHDRYFKTFFYLLKKINLETIKQNNHAKIEQDGPFIELENRLDLSEIELMEREESFEVYSPLEDIFQESGGLYNQLIKEYVQYMMDISVNQYSVHWCGHSSQMLHIPYQQFESLVVDSFKLYLGKIVEVAKQVNDPVMAVDSILKSTLQQLDKEYLKPVTLKKLINCTQKQTVAFVGQQKYLCSQLFQTIKLIRLDFQNRDKLLDHFNENANINNQISYKYSIVLQNEDFNKALKTSASTNTSRNSNNLSGNLQMKSSHSIMSEDFS